MNFGGVIRLIQDKIDDFQDSIGELEWLLNNPDEIREWTSADEIKRDIVDYIDNIMECKDAIEILRKNTDEI